MSNIGVHDFEIPHEFVQPVRDMVIIRVPVPPIVMGTSGKLIIPEQFRAVAGHNVQAGRIVAMGPMAFFYKDGASQDSIARQDVKIGDWVIIRPYAGTSLEGGKLAKSTGWRYVSSYSDVLGLIPTDKMPNPETLLWSEQEAEALLKKTAEAAGVAVPVGKPDFNFDNRREVQPMFEGQ
jgi:co-chaperonin GroES (HSP10)